MMRPTTSLAHASCLASSSSSCRSLTSCVSAQDKLAPAAPQEVPASAVEAARQGELQLVLVALMSQSRSAMGMAVGVRA